MSNQKTTKPTAEEVIPDILDGDMKKNAMKFAAYMRENKMLLKQHSTSPGSQSAKYKGKIICEVLLSKNGNSSFGTFSGSHWLVIPNICHATNYEDLILKEELQNIIWNNPLYCRWGKNRKLSTKTQNCDPKKHRCAGGTNLTLCGKTLIGVCYCRPYPIICNPDETEIKAIKRLVELEKRARDEKNINSK